MKITFGDINTRVQYGFPAVALLSTTGKCLVSPTLNHGSISLLFTSHFNAFFFLHCLNALVRRLSTQSLNLF